MMKEAGTLFVVATPIGNLEDITLRALRVLGEADAVAAEDTRHTAKLLTHHGIRARLVSFQEHNQARRTPQLLQLLREGRKVALVTDAGTPTISDPGVYLVQQALSEGLTVAPVPGPSAVTAALSVSGIRSQAFAFEGFLPSRVTQRRKRLRELAGEPRTMVFYESPKRLERTLADMLEVWGDRQIAVAKELTKVFETVYRGSLSAVLSGVRSEGARGEYTLVVSGAAGRSEEGTESLADELRRLMTEEGLSSREAITEAARRRGIPRREAYRESLGVKGKTSGKA